MAIPVALQMYTVRDKTAEDFAGTFRAVADIGYDAVELAGDGGLSAEAMRTLLDECGLGIVGSHVGIERLESDLPAVADYNLTIGNPHIVVPWLPESLRGDCAAWRAMGQRLEAIGVTLSESGLTLCYHNHAFEFETKEDGLYGLDWLYEASDPGYLQAEIDTYWVQAGGEDPAAYVAKLRDRAPLIHLKDMTPGDQPTFCEVGTGILDFESIFKAAEGGPVAAWIVEQDVCRRPSLESAKISHDNLRRMLAG